MDDPAQDLIVVALTNTHLNTGIERWENRLQAIVACTIAYVSTSSRYAIIYCGEQPPRLNSS
jgi:hypothetical protein